MLRGLPCKSAGLATSSKVGSTAFSCCSPACGSGIGSATNSQTASLAVSTRMKRCHARVRTKAVHGRSWCDAFWYKAIERTDRAREAKWPIQSFWADFDRPILEISHWHSKFGQNKSCRGQDELQLLFWAKVGLKLGSLRKTRSNTAKTTFTARTRLTLTIVINLN